ncbi:MAG: hypothetical protein BLM47_09295 [Candidatus Reconcilbacillus cellulovorans]|mgnify:FL=1|uniref:Uncharacterized protein n=1 Tax=Candidatus Reconcilbacillus cellulovorans TaxID=1906605 RepID=A0A2A6DYD4_9BACL|nr:MAG: hypothetical protein BLM47_09295 [Candidatus Reconcilbacillus cellulovorans]
MKRNAFCLASTLVLAVMASWTSASAVEPPKTTAGQRPAGEARDSWIAAQMERIAAAEGFADWLGAHLEIFPLGPGTHGWLVLLSRDNRRVGFLTVYDDGRGGWTIGEYGHGEPPA